MKVELKGEFFMYKSKLIGLILIIAMLAGCSTKESVSKPAQTEPSIDLPYEIIRDDDGYYLLLDDSSTTDNEAEVSSQLLKFIHFGSMDEMVQDIKTGNFTEKELLILSIFPKDEDGRTILCDLSKLYEAYAPEQLGEKSITWYGNRYTFSFGDKEKELHYNMRIGFSNTQKEERIEQLMTGADKRNFTLLSTESAEDRNATVVTHISGVYDGIRERKTVYYTLKDSNKEVFVCEDYSYAEDEVPYFIEMYGTENGMNYRVSFAVEGQDRPSVEFLMSFGVREYVETEVA